MTDSKHFFDSSSHFDFEDSRFPPQPQSPKKKSNPLWRIASGVLIGIATLVVSAILLVLLGLAVMYPNLPDVSSLQDYQPKLPLRIYSADGHLISEFGEERRHYLPFHEIPQDVKNAVLAIEDARFYEHGGVDYVGVLRAGLANLSRSRSQGASTITMQVARNVYLSSEKTFTRKIYEMLLALKLERSLTKDQILEIYMNQIFLGNRAYGFAAAAEAYFGKSIKDINLAEAAMLAALPKFPSTANPIVNPERARIRQMYILDRMVETGFISPAQATEAKNTQLVLQRATRTGGVHADYVGEMVRQMVFAQYGQDAYTRGLEVFTTISTKEQNAAYAAVRAGILQYEARRAYRGPEHTALLPEQAGSTLEAAIADALAEFPDSGEFLSAVVLEASPKQITARRADSSTPIVITGKGLRFVTHALSRHASAKQQIRRGSVIRIAKNGDEWEVRQLPEVEAALVAMDPRTGAIKSLVGGFDYAKNKFNHATQAYRQPGSSFKPFVYSAALEAGVSPSTMVSDSELVISSSQTGGATWAPKNYDGSFGPPLTVRQALAKSRNLVSVRLIQTVGAAKAQEWAARFGFPAERTPPYLTLALGASSTTPLELASGYAVFANGGYAVRPYLIALIRDQRGNVISQVTPPALDESLRTIPARNAFIMNSLLNEVTMRGTAASATSALGRSDLYGKTGTTNESKDAWFAGFQSNLVAVVWMGFSSPRNLGDRETGGGLSLPIWIRFMRTALQGVPLTDLTQRAPAGVVRAAGDWMYAEYAKGRGGINEIDLDSYTPPGDESESGFSPSSSGHSVSGGGAGDVDIFRGN